MDRGDYARRMDGRIEEPTIIVMASAFSGFIMGLLLMGLLWWIWP